MLHHEYPTDLLNGAYLYQRENSRNFCNNTMEADLLDTLLSGKCIVPSDDNIGGRVCSLMFIIIVAPA